MNSMFLATVIGWYMLAFGLLMLIRQQQMKSVLTEIIGHKGVFFIMALMTFILGLMIVVSHNSWVNDWTVSITIFGWFVLIGGLMRLFFLDEVLKMAKSLVKEPMKMKVFAVFCLIFGAYLLFHVYY